MSHRDSPSTPSFRAQNSEKNTDDQPLDFAWFAARLEKGAAAIVGLAALGLVLGSLVYLVFSRSQQVTTSTRVVFAFPGFDRGEYPDKSKFQIDDLRSPSTVAEAIRRQQLDLSKDFQSTIRGALNIEGIIPPNIVKERDRLRALGQTPAPFVADEYRVTLVLPAAFKLNDEQRNRLLNEVISVYRETFQRAYGKAPVAFGSVFDTLRTADFPEYEIILNAEMNTIRAYLATQMEISKNYRSPTTNLSFKDLAEQVGLFSQINLNEVLGLIHENGLSRNRGTAMMKMNYYLGLLAEREQHALEDEKVVRDLLEQTQSRAQNVVLGIKSQAGQSRPETPLIDQGLIDSLIANDAYNFLIRKSLEAGLVVKSVQAEKNQLLGLRNNMKTFVEAATGNQQEIMVRVEKSLKDLESSYTRLIANIRQTQLDFAAQQFGSAVRISDVTTTDKSLKPLFVAAAIGCFLGGVLGAGLSLLGIYVGRPATQ